MAKRIGTKTLQLTSSPSVLGFAAVGAKKEKEGPLADYFDYLSDDSSFGEKTWEKAETLMQQKAIHLALQKCGVQKEQIDFLFAGDLLNQCISSAYASREMAIPFFGLYGACSTMAESLCVGAMLVDGGHMRNALCAASSHFCTAERQYRFPLEYGSQRTPPPSGRLRGGAALISAEVNFKPLARCAMVTVGTVTDMGIADANNMGAAMAPAAYDTLRAHFTATATGPEDYDLIVTGDLGLLGHQIVTDLFRQDGVDMTKNYTDCGLLLYHLEKQDMHAGGSGCGCSAAVFNGYLLRGLREGRWKRLLFAPTGALLSPTSSFQGGVPSPGICHAVALSAAKEECKPWIT